MSGQIEFYRNHNGKVTKGTKVLPNDYSIGDVLSDLFTGSGCLFDEALHMTPRAHNREVCSERFPVSSQQVDKETKVLNIDIAACGIKKDEVTIDIDNDTILVKFNKSQAAKDSRLYVDTNVKSGQKYYYKIRPYWRADSKTYHGKISEATKGRKIQIEQET